MKKTEQKTKKIVRKETLSNGSEVYYAIFDNGMEEIVDEITFMNLDNAKDYIKIATSPSSDPLSDRFSGKWWNYYDGKYNCFSNLYEFQIRRVHTIYDDKMEDLEYEISL